MQSLSTFPAAVLAALLSAGTAQACEPVAVGALVIDDVWSRATVGTNRPGVIYLTIRNDGASDDALTGIATSVAAMPMLHETVLADGVASMRHAMAVPVPAGQTVMLEPGGYHGMLMDLTQTLEEGKSFPVTLTFQNAGEVQVPVAVGGIGAADAGCPAS